MSAPAEPTPPRPAGRTGPFRRPMTVAPGNTCLAARLGKTGAVATAPTRTACAPTLSPFPEDALHASPRMAPTAPGVAKRSGARMVGRIAAVRRSEALAP